MKTSVTTLSASMAVSILLGSCGNVGGGEDRTAPVVSLGAPVGTVEIVGELAVSWQSDEPNPSVVDLYLSSDAGASWELIATDIPDTGSYLWDSNLAADCRQCRIRIVATDVAGNVSAPADSTEDFVINNVPQVLGDAYYTDSNANGQDAGDTIRVSFDKRLILKTSIASDIFEIPVEGDSIGAFAKVAVNPADNRELIITLNDIGSTNYHLQTPGRFDAARLNMSAPSGLNLRSDISAGILSATDTGRTADRVAGGVDITSSFADTGVTVGNVNTRDIALADVDDDGDLDIIEALSGEANRVLINDGSGVFVDSGQTLGNSITTVITVGDINGDGAVDFAEGIIGANRVWLNDGNGNFDQTAQNLGSGTTEDLVLGDLDGDGDLDMVEAVNGAAGKIWKNVGLGLFVDSGNDFGNGAFSLALADVDADGDLDIIEATANGVNNRIWLNDGNGSFTDSGQLLSSGLTRAVITGDVDGDGDLDIIEGIDTNVLETGNRIWLNDGSGVFADSGQVMGNHATKSLLLVDVDGDGDRDIVEGVDGILGRTGRVWINGGDSSGSNTGLFTDSGQQLGNEATASLAAGDVDGDGDVDIVEAVEGKANRIYLNSLRNVNDELYRASSRILGNSNTTAIALGDIDGDGDLDIVEAIVGAGNRIWINDGQGEYRDSGQSLGVMDTFAIVLADVDGDGDRDIIDGNTNGANELWLNDGQGRFTESMQLPGNAATYSMVAGDLDGDGDIDLVEGNESADNLVWLNDGQGGFVDSQQALGNSITRALALADIDDDGDLDVIEGIDGEGNRVWLNNGQGVFTDSGQALGNSSTSAIAAGDFDGDGDADIYEGVITGPNILWENNGNGNFTVLAQTPNPDATRAVALVDVDSDGDLDLVEGIPNEPIFVWINRNNQFFSDLINLPSGNEFIFSIAAGDIDNDNDIDLVSGITGGGNRLWLNDF